MSYLPCTHNGNNHLSAAAQAPGGKLASFDARDPLSGETFVVDRCPVCSTGSCQVPLAEISSYYGDDYYGSRHGFTHAWCLARRRALIEGEIGRGHLLDVGCGDGSFLRACERAGWNSCVGVEIAPEAARAGGSRVHSGIDEAQRENKVFDAITLWHSLEHVVTPNETLATCRKLVAPMGKLFVAVPNFGGWQARAFGADWLHLDVPRHRSHFTQEGLSTLLQATGWRVTRWHHQELEYDVFGWLQSALNKMDSANPNLLFRSLTGKNRNARASVRVCAHGAAAAVMAPLAFAATTLGTLAGQGGTLIAVAQPE